MGKHDPLLRIDRRIPNAGGGFPLKIESPATQATAPMAAAPTALALSTDLELVDQTYFAFLEVTWQPPTSFKPATYELRLSWTGPAGPMSRTISWNHDDQRVTDFLPQLYRFERVEAGVAHTVEVRAISLGGSPSEWVSVGPIVSADDTAAPGEVDDLAAVWATGTLEATWTPPDDRDLKDYVVEVWNSSAMSLRYAIYEEAKPRFTWTPAENREALGSTYASAVYVTIQARDHRNNLSTRVGVNVSNGLPGVVTGITQSWSGDAGVGTADSTWTLRWTNPSDRDIKHVLVTVDGVDYPLPAGTTRFDYTLAMNAAAHGNVPDPNLAWQILLVDVLEQAGTPVSGTATNAVPPVLTSYTQSWAGDATAGLAGATLSLTWVVPPGISDLAYTRITIDTSNVFTVPVGATRFDYERERNRQDHGDVLDASAAALDVVLELVDQFAQAGPASSFTATNGAPPQPSITVTPFYSALAVSLSTVGGPARDLAYYQLTLERADASGGPWTVLRTVQDVSPAPILEQLPSTGWYRVGVQAFDVFGQARAAVQSSATRMDPLTLEQLRELVLYVDSAGTNVATLKAQLADDIRNTGGIAHTANSPSWRWTEARRPVPMRQRKITIAATGGVGYVGTSSDSGLSYTWYSGPLQADGVTLTQVASEAAAQAAALALPSDGTWQLPGWTEAAWVRLVHRHTSSYTLREFFPRTFWQIDDLDAEIIRGMTVVGREFVADRLSALTTTLGTVDILTSGYLRSGQSGYDTGMGFYLGNDGGTPRMSIGNSAGDKLLWNGSALNVTGQFNLSGVATIGAAGGLYQGSSGSFAAPGTGLKIWNDGGVGRLATYSGGTVQVQFDTDGTLSAGAGAVRLNSAGLKIRSASGTSIPGNSAPNTIDFVSSSGAATFGRLLSFISSNGEYNLGMYAQISTEGSSGGGAITLGFYQGSNYSPGGARLRLSSSGAITLTGDVTIGSGGLNVGFVSGAGTGDVYAAGGLLVGGAAANGGVRAIIKGGGNTSGTAALRLLNSSNADMFTVYNNGDATVAGSLATAGIGSFSGAGLNTGVALNMRCVSGLVGLRIATSGGTVFFDTWDDRRIELSGLLDLVEQSTPAAPTVNTARLFARDNGAGKTQLCVIFNTGAVQVLATQP
jgi:hypothetical protein